MDHAAPEQLVMTLTPASRAGPFMPDRRLADRRQAAGSGDVDVEGDVDVQDEGTVPLSRR